MENVQPFKISLEDITLATNDFSKENFISQGGFGKVYKGTLPKTETTVAVKRLNREFGQGEGEFWMEIEIHKYYKHENMITLVGFCNESDEYILVYEYVEHGSLDKYITRINELSWIQRLEISIGVARCLNYLHNDEEHQLRVVHCDIKSSNILLKEKSVAKISDFGLSKKIPLNVENTLSNPCGTKHYVDPEYERDGTLSKECDVYSFGVVLLEILCGKLAHNIYREEPWAFYSLPDDQTVHSDLEPQIREDSLKIFSDVAYACLKQKRSERPNMAWIVENLNKALELQVMKPTSIGPWGRQSGDGYWSFELKRKHHLWKISVDHGDHVIYSLMFTWKSKGVSHPPKKFGGANGGETIEEVTFDDDEKLIGISGTFGTRDNSIIISSLSFVTNKNPCVGPFGRSSASDSEFSITWKIHKGSLVGFYGFAGYYIDGIGVYVKAYKETMGIEKWGGDGLINSSKTEWSFKLKRYDRLKSIRIRHGHQIYSFSFVTERYPFGISSSYLEAVGTISESEVNFDSDEELCGICGTVGQSEGEHVGITVITSILFVTNKRSSRRFGQERGKHFAVQWDNGQFAGFYGLCGSYIDSISVKLKTTAKTHT